MAGSCKLKHCNSMLRPFGYCEVRRYDPVLSFRLPHDKSSHILRSTYRCNQSITRTVTRFPSLPRLRGLDSPYVSSLEILEIPASRWVFILLGLCVHWVLSSSQLLCLAFTWRSITTTTNRLRPRCKLLPGRSGRRSYAWRPRIHCLSSRNVCCSSCSTVFSLRQLTSNSVVSEYGPA